MATITIHTKSLRDAKKVLTRVYNADRQGGFVNNKKSFSGSVLTAQIADNNSVEITSSYYQEISLKQMFDF